MLIAFYLIAINLRELSCKQGIHFFCFQDALGLCTKYFIPHAPYRTAVSYCHFTPSSLVTTLVIVARAQRRPRLSPMFLFVVSLIILFSITTLKGLVTGWTD